MKNVMALAAVAGLLVTSAIAKDLPRRKAEPEPEARKATGCEFIGEGYVKAPGSDTCVRLGGSMRVEGSYTRSR